MSQPIPPPISPLAYAAPMARRLSPWRITISVISMVVAALGGVMSLLGILQSVVMLVVRNMPLPMPTTLPSPVAPPTVPSGTGTTTLALTATSGPSTVTSPLYSANPFSSIPQWVSIGSLVFYTSAVVLSVLLLVAGIMMVIRKPSSVRMHLFWATLKIPQVILLAISYGLFMNAMYSLTMSMNPSGASTPVDPGVLAYMMAGFTAMLSLVYPVFLLIALTRPGVRRSIMDDM